MYDDCRRRLERAVENSTDMSAWTLVQSKSDMRMYQNERNVSNQQCGLRMVIQVPGSVYSTLEMLRLLDSPSFRMMMKELHGKTFIDGEVLCSDMSRRHDDVESLALKWMALNTGKMFTKPKEFLYYEYCGVHNSRKFGPTGVCLLESYDGIGAQYGIRARPDSYKLASFEPSYFVMTPSNEHGKTVITISVSAKKAGGSNLVSPALRDLLMKFTSNYVNLEAIARTSSIPDRVMPQREPSPPPPPPPSRSYIQRTSSGEYARSSNGSRVSSHHSPENNRGTSLASSEGGVRKKKAPSKRQEYINADFEEICRSAMQALDCPMAGIRTNLFELVHYVEHVNPSEMPKSLPTFRRMAQSGKPCVVLDVNSDKRISTDDMDNPPSPTASATSQGNNNDGDHGELSTAAPRRRRQLLAELWDAASKHGVMRRPKTAASTSVTTEAAEERTEEKAKPSIQEAIAAVRRAWPYGEWQGAEKV
ncbi:hypothetical protein Ae201684_014468 [Aphanomyces euteiches]|uniref:START domain-containing protein n=2 Tax=Aphanomyces euteiches TaxID=100861 RepID=A0A6G0WK84_9STRA|nr:hypothetical protein Ae201684_014468 [Aphanomyces euteiches]